MNDKMLATDKRAPDGVAGQQYTTLTYDVGGFLTQCVDKYKELAGPRGANLRKVDTPYLDERLEGDGIGSPDVVAAAAAKGRSTTRSGMQMQQRRLSPMGGPRGPPVEVPINPPNGVVNAPERQKDELASIAA